MTTVVKTEVANNYFHVSLSDGSTNEFHLGAHTASMIGAWCASHDVVAEDWLPSVEEFKKLKDEFFR